jgi:hypothetical protein
MNDFWLIMDSGLLAADGGRNLRTNGEQRLGGLKYRGIVRQQAIAFKINIIVNNPAVTISSYRVQPVARARPFNTRME